MHHAPTRCQPRLASRRCSCGVYFWSAPDDTWRSFLGTLYIHSKLYRYRFPVPYGQARAVHGKGGQGISSPSAAGGGQVREVCYTLSWHYGELYVAFGQTEGVCCAPWCEQPPSSTSCAHATIEGWETVGHRFWLWHWTCS